MPPHPWGCPPGGGGAKSYRAAATNTDLPMTFPRTMTTTTTHNPGYECVSPSPPPPSPSIADPHLARSDSCGFGVGHQAAPSFATSPRRLARSWLSQLTTARGPLADGGGGGGGESAGSQNALGAGGSQNAAGAAVTNAATGGSLVHRRIASQNAAAATASHNAAAAAAANGRRSASCDQLGTRTRGAEKGGEEQ